MNRGFTLIELLVVVLIIGILAAVALPQYQKAVTKSRVAQYWPVLKTIYEARRVCELQKGELCTDLAELDVEAPAGTTYDLSSHGYESETWPQVCTGQITFPGYSNSYNLCIHNGHRVCFGPNNDPSNFCRDMGFIYSYGAVPTIAYTDEAGLE